MAPKLVMPGRVPGLQALVAEEDVDGRDEPGHDENNDPVVPGLAKREPGIHNHYSEYGFRACAKWRIPE